MKAAVLSTISRNAGGLFYSVRWLSKGLAQAGVEIQVLSPRDEFSDEDITVWNRLPIDLVKVSGPLQRSQELRDKLSSLTPDLIHVHGIWMDQQWAALQAQKMRGTPVVISPRGMLDPWALKNSQWKKKLAGMLFANASLKRATVIHALCRSEAESIRAYGLKNPIALIPNGVELPELKEVVPKNTSAKKQLLFLGRIHPKKGVSELIDAWKRANAECAEWELLIAGWDDGGHEDGLKALCKQHGLDDSVQFIGPQFGEEKEALLRSVDGFILPSFSEGLPMSVLEAWSYQLPVIITDFCNIPEGFEHQAAVRVEPNASSIADGLIQFTSMSAEHRAEIGARGRKLVEDQFTWPTIAGNMKKVYEWCCSGNNPPDCIEFYE